MTDSIAGVIDSNLPSSILISRLLAEQNVPNSFALLTRSAQDAVFAWLRTAASAEDDDDDLVRAVRLLKLMGRSSFATRTMISTMPKFASLQGHQRGMFQNRFTEELEVALVFLARSSSRTKKQRILEISQVLEEIERHMLSENHVQLLFEVMVSAIRALTEVDHASKRVKDRIRECLRVALSIDGVPVSFLLEHTSSLPKWLRMEIDGTIRGLAVEEIRNPSLHRLRKAEILPLVKVILSTISEHEMVQPSSGKPWIEILREILVGAPAESYADALCLVEMEFQTERAMVDAMLQFYEGYCRQARSGRELESTVKKFCAADVGILLCLISEQMRRLDSQTGKSPSLLLECLHLNRDRLDLEDPPGGSQAAPLESCERLIDTFLQIPSMESLSRTLVELSLEWSVPGKKDSRANRGHAVIAILASVFQHHSSSREHVLRAVLGALASRNEPRFVRDLMLRALERISEKSIFALTSHSSRVQVRGSGLHEGHSTSITDRVAQEWMDFLTWMEPSDASRVLSLLSPLSRISSRFREGLFIRLRKLSTSRRDCEKELGISGLVGLLGYVMRFISPRSRTEFQC